MAADIGPPPGNVASGASLEDSRQSARSQAFIAPAFVAAMEAERQSGPEFDLELVESTVLDGRTQKLVYVPHIHAGIPEGAGPKVRAG